MASDDLHIDVEALERKYAEERARRLRALEADRSDEPGFAGEYAGFDTDRYADATFTRAPVAEQVDVLVIGGGIGGILTAARLRRRGVQSIRIIEKGADFGGTWYWNRYPGAACDVESYIYFPMLEDSGYMPRSRYSQSPEIRTYLQGLARQCGLYPLALFQTLVTGLCWDARQKRWQARSDRGDEVAARYVVSCTGVLSNPRLPKIPGISRFRGHSFHTSRWDYGYTGGEHDGRLTGLQDKVVGIIGTGATAVQSIPHLAEWARQLFVFQRTPSSIDERGNRPTDPDWYRAASATPGWQGARQENFASIMSGNREPVDLVDDGWTEILRSVYPPPGSEVGPEGAQGAGYRRMEVARQRIAHTVKDSVTADALKPYFHYFCKRPCFHDEYLDAFNRANCTLVDTRGQGVTEITPTGVIAGGKEYRLDCLVYATGFDFLLEYTRESGFEVHGRDGISLSDHWREGPRTLYAVQTDRFPNLFFLRLAQAGHSPNYTLTVEGQCQYIVEIIARALAQDGLTVEASKEAVDAWVAEVIAKGAPRQQFLETCTPGQYNYEGNPDRRRFAMLNDLYGGGPSAYFNLLRDLRSGDVFTGLRTESAGARGE